MLAIPFLQAVVLATTIVGEVVGVADGDTLTLLTTDKREVRVRLAEIDAPEKTQPFGSRAKQALSALVFGKQVRVQVQDTDRYGRAVGRVHAGKLDVNAELVRTGMAWIYRRYSRDPALPLIEKQARAARVGLWSDSSPVPPWDYRRAGRGRKGPQAAPPPSGGSATVKCSTKRYCSEMTSCEEARAYLKQCGLRTIDGDGDGVPCEALCR